VTGYRPFGKQAPHELVKKYEQEARGIHELNLSTVEEKDKLTVLVDRFLSELSELEEE